jgi:hypothetical protein
VVATTLLCGGVTDQVKHAAVLDEIKPWPTERDGRVTTDAGTRLA